MDNDVIASSRPLPKKKENQLRKARALSERRVTWAHSQVQHDQNIIQLRPIQIQSPSKQSVHKGYMSEVEEAENLTKTPIKRTPKPLVKSKNYSLSPKEIPKQKKNIPFWKPNGNKLETSKSNISHFSCQRDEIFTKEKNVRKSCSSFEIDSVNRLQGFGDQTGESINDLRQTIEITKSRLWKIYNTLTTNTQNGHDKARDNAILNEVKTKIILKKLQMFNISRLTLKCVSLRPEDVIGMAENLQFALDHDPQFVVLANGSPREFAKRTGHEVSKFTRLESLGLTLEHLAMLNISQTDLALAGHYTAEKGVGATSDDTETQTAVEMVSIGTYPIKNFERPINRSMQTENIHRRICETQTKLQMNEEKELQIIENKLRLFNIDKRRLETVGLSLEIIQVMTEEINRFVLKGQDLNVVTTKWPEIAVKSLEALGLTIQHLALLTVSPFDVAAFNFVKPQSPHNNNTISTNNNNNNNNKQIHHSNIYSRNKAKACFSPPGISCRLHRFKGPVPSRNKLFKSEYHQKIIDNNKKKVLEIKAKSFNEWLKSKVNNACKSAEVKERSVVDVMEANVTPVERVIMLEGRKTNQSSRSGATYTLVDDKTSRSKADSLTEDERKQKPSLQVDMSTLTSERVFRNESPTKHRWRY